MIRQSTPAVEAIVPVWTAIYTFFNPIASAGFGAFALYLFLFKNGEIEFDIAELFMFIFLGLFAGYITDQIYIVLTPILTAKHEAGGLDSITFAIFADGHNLFVALSGFLSQKLLKILNNLKLEALWKKH